MKQSLVRRVWNSYNQQIQVKNPVKAKMATCFILFGLGDMTCQGIELRVKQREKPEMKFQWDAMRTLRQGTAAMFLNNLMA